MKKILLMAVVCNVLYLSHPALAQHNVNLTGTYQTQDGLGSHVFLKKRKSNQYYFFLYAQRGAPGYNSGSAESIVTFKGNMAKLADPKYPDCRITLTLKNNKQMVLAQNSDSSSCGFGANVNASGVYHFQSKKINTKQSNVDSFQYFP